MVVDVEFRCYLWFLSPVLEEECLDKNEAQKFFKTVLSNNVKNILNIF